MIQELKREIADLTLTPTDDAGWQKVAKLWKIREDSVYLNHGSFGPSPLPVRDYRRKIIDQLDEQPMDFFVRRLEPLLLAAREDLAQFLGTDAQKLVFVENATFGVNVVAESFPFVSGDEVLLNDHEYGAVRRTFERLAARKSLNISVANISTPIASADQVVADLMRCVTPKTKLAVISHITSPTAIVLPVKQICRAFQERGIAVCIDGPHAPAHVPLDLEELGCDFYAASCHKWLCAPLGSGFLFVDPRWHKFMQPIIKSWGRLLPAMPENWDEEFLWSGTRDPSCYLSVPTAIETLRIIGFERFRSRCYSLAAYAREKLVELTGEEPLAPADWYGCMAHVPLPSGEYSDLQRLLWDVFRIEVPIIEFNGRWFVRVSCHVYNHIGQIDLLIEALKQTIPGLGK
ncbi:MAG TPA: aminotransferase class V-fold PLP-dependent enzyme [Pirellulaceae bacterium]|nr:aminotransferase class V-fold PLP-dependent enzyme [Pirellulaceae bacterium]HMO90948.1 aminotransferase class V-fold PLP-dependent enzyme [Pirellulaceae bacterium]HMP69846.1 aminotransferase class V-fold PLP-dependent enzyme [Pirellulaceae bacterium]